MNGISVAVTVVVLPGGSCDATASAIALFS